MSSTLMKTDCDYMDINNDKKMPALNWRFGASGGVSPRKVQWEYER
jgi:agmatine/peptidylarginine deiminase